MIFHSMKKKGGTKRKRNHKEEATTNPTQEDTNKYPAKPAAANACFKEEETKPETTKAKRAKTSKHVSEPEFFEEKRNLVMFLLLMHVLSILYAHAFMYVDINIYIYIYIIICINYHLLFVFTFYRKIYGDMFFRLELRYVSFYFLMLTQLITVLYILSSSILAS